MVRVGTAAAALLTSAIAWTSAGAVEANIAPRSWDGYYIGVNAGYLRANASWSDNFGFTTGDFSGSGTAIGLTAGKNRQRGRWVYGIEGDLSLAELRAESFALACFPISCRSDLTSLATLRGRLGYLYAPDLLVFGTAGAAAAGLDHGNFFFSSAKNTAFGFTVGAGVEKRIAPQWTVKAEYLFVHIGGNEACSASLCLVSVENDKFQAHVFRVGLNRHFGQSSPVTMPPASQNRWTGFYAGAFTGYARADTEYVFPLGATTGRFDGDGMLGGVNLGYNWQNGRWVYGVEGDASFVAVKASFFGALETEISQLFTLRGRAGYLVMPGTLLFASGGVAAAPMKFSLFGLGTASSLEFAPVVGAGLEVRLSGNWTVKGEYLFAAFGSADPCGVLCAGLVSSDYLNLSQLRVGINRYF